MIDKVDLRIPEFASPGPMLEGPFEQLKKAPSPLFRPSRFYQYVCDLREPFGVDAVVHLYLRFGRPNHKVEIIDAGEKTIREMADIVTQLFAVDPWPLQLMRADLAADLDGVSVPWLQRHAFVSRKQFSSRIEKSFEEELQFIGMGTAMAQTLYAGKRPNLIRIYNKLAEWRIQLRRLEIQYKRFNERMNGMEMTEEQVYYGRRIAPTFVDYCKDRGYQLQPDSVLTRVERQIGGSRFPPELATLNDLRYAHDFYPFAGVHIVGGESPLNFDSPPAGTSMRDWFAAIGYETLKERLGSEQLARSFVLKCGNGNGKRILESLDKCRPAKGHAVTVEDIQESFRKSTVLQTSNSSQVGVCLSPTYERKEQIA